MDPIRTHGWRVALVLSGIAMLIGAPRHPESEASDGLRDELATMTVDPDWVFAHVFVVASTLLLAVGLAAAYRTSAWPSRTRRALGVAAVVVSLYTVEAVFHLAAAVDTQALQHGDFAPVASTHILLSVVLYPLTGVAVFALAALQLATWRGPRKLAALAGLAFGLLHFLSIPLTLLLPDTELAPVFAGAAISAAVWGIATGLVGAPREARIDTTPVPVAV